MSKLADWLEEHMMSCFYKKFLGVECPGCGFQRSLYHLLKGEFVESLKTYPALIPTLLMVFFLISHLIFKFKNGHKVLLALFYLNVVLILTNYIVKLVT